MKKKIFLGLGAAVLAVGGVFAGRASAKFATATSMYYKIGAGACTTIASTLGNTAFQTASSGTVATIRTQGNTASATLYGTSTCSAGKVLYFHP